MAARSHAMQTCKEVEGTSESLPSNLRQQEQCFDFPAGFLQPCSLHAKARKHHYGVALFCRWWCMSKSRGSSSPEGGQCLIIIVFVFLSLPNSLAIAAAESKAFSSSSTTVSGGGKATSGQGKSAVPLAMQQPVQVGMFVDG